MTPVGHPATLARAVFLVDLHPFHCQYEVPAAVHTTPDTAGEEGLRRIDQLSRHYAECVKQVAQALTQKHPLGLTWNYAVFDSHDVAMRTSSVAANNFLPWISSSASTFRDALRHLLKEDAQPKSSDTESGWSQMDTIALALKGLLDEFRWKETSMEIPVATSSYVFLLAPCPRSAGDLIQIVRAPDESQLRHVEHRCLCSIGDHSIKSSSMWTKTSYQTCLKQLTGAWFRQETKTAALPSRSPFHHFRQNVILFHWIDTRALVLVEMSSDHRTRIPSSVQQDTDLTAHEDLFNAFSAIGSRIIPAEMLIVDDLFFPRSAWFAQILSSTSSEHPLDTVIINVRDSTGAVNDFQLLCSSLFPPQLSPIPSRWEVVRFVSISITSMQSMMLHHSLLAMCFPNSHHIGNLPVFPRPARETVTALLVVAKSSAQAATNKRRGLLVPCGLSCYLLLQNLLEEDEYAICPANCSESILALSNDSADLDTRLYAPFLLQYLQTPGHDTLTDTLSIKVIDEWSNAGLASKSASTPCSPMQSIENPFMSECHNEGERTRLSFLDDCLRKSLYQYQVNFVEAQRNEQKQPDTMELKVMSMENADISALHNVTQYEDMMESLMTAYLDALYLAPTIAAHKLSPDRNKKSSIGLVNERVWSSLSQSLRYSSTVSSIAPRNRNVSDHCYAIWQHIMLYHLLCDLQKLDSRHFMRHKIFEIDDSILKDNLLSFQEFMWQSTNSRVSDYSLSTSCQAASKNRDKYVENGTITSGCDALSVELVELGTSLINEHEIPFCKRLCHSLVSGDQRQKMQSSTVTDIKYREMQLQAVVILELMRTCSASLPVESAVSPPNATHPPLFSSTADSSTSFHSTFCFHSCKCSSLNECIKKMSPISATYDSLYVPLCQYLLTILDRLSIYRMGTSFFQDFLNRCITLIEDHPVSSSLLNAINGHFGMLSSPNSRILSSPRTTSNLKRPLTNDSPLPRKKKNGENKQGNKRISKRVAGTALYASSISDDDSIVQNLESDVHDSATSTGFEPQLPPQAILALRRSSSLSEKLMSNFSRRIVTDFPVQRRTVSNGKLQEHNVKQSRQGMEKVHPKQQSSTKHLDDTRSRRHSKTVITHAKEQPPLEKSVKRRLERLPDQSSPKLILATPNKPSSDIMSFFNRSPLVETHHATSDVKSISHSLSAVANRITRSPIWKLSKALPVTVDESPIRTDPNAGSLSQWLLSAVRALSPAKLLSPRRSTIVGVTQATNECKEELSSKGVQRSRRRLFD